MWGSRARGTWRALLVIGFVLAGGLAGGPAKAVEGVHHISINDVSQLEGSSGGSTTFTFTVTVSPAATDPITVNYSTANGSAKAGSDYTAATGSVTFATGETTKTIPVTVAADTSAEPDETFTVTITDPPNATLDKGTGTGTIQNDDGTPPSLSISDTTVTEGNTGSTNATLNVTLTPASTQTVTVNYTTANGTATAPGDYTTSSGTLTFAPTETSKSILVPINGDTVDEANETLTVTLSSPDNASLTDGSGQVTITDDDAAPTITISDATVTEGTGTGGTAQFVVTLSAPSAQTVSVNYATANGTATSPADYTAGSGTLTFTPGQTTQNINVAIAGDSLDEANETFVVNLTAPTNATIADNQGQGTITDDDSGPTLSVSDVTLTEGNTGTTNANFTVTLTPASGQTVTVDYATANGTASAPGDYSSRSGTLTFTPGQTQQVVGVPVVGDTLDEANETFFLNLTAPTNATTSDAQGQATINDDDGAAVLSINDVTVTEGNSGSPKATFLVTLLPASGQTVTVHYATANGTATSPADYAATSGDLTFNPGETSKSVEVSIVPDTMDENNETFVVNLTAPTNATISDAQGQATINDDDGAPTAAINDVTQAEGNSGTSNFVFAVTLSSASGKTVTIDYATANNSATAPSDYAATNGTVTFAPGETTKNITVVVNGDTAAEPDETFLVNLSNPTNTSLTDTSGVGTITTDDGASPALSVSDVTVTEGNSGTVNAAFTVTLTPTSTQTVTVQYATADGTATAPGDYTSVSNTLTFAPGETTKTVNVPVNGDALDEVNETFTLNLSSPSNASITDGSGTGTITDDDTPPTVSVNDVSVTEGNTGTTPMQFTATLSAPSGQTVTVAYAASNGTATQPDDYAATSGTATFPAGTTTQTITVPVVGDTVDEPNETVNMTLSAPTNATIADGSGVGTINDNDATPTLSIADKSAFEGNSGTTPVAFTVTLSAASGQAVTVNYATANGTATSGSDYDAASGTLNFAPGQTTAEITVPYRGDTTPEPNETFTITLSNPTNATIADGSATGTVANDDAGQAGEFTAVAPSRLLDTRPNAALQAGQVRDLIVVGVGGVPATGAGAVVLNVTITEPTIPSHLTVFPKGQAVPNASNLNFVAGETAPNLVTVKVGAEGKVSLRLNAGSAHAIADVVGWYSDGTAPPASLYHAQVPNRILDTRTNATPLQGNQPRNVTVAGVGGVPADATAVVMNVTITEPTQQSHLTVYPSGQAAPNASNLNFVAGQTRPNLVTVKVGAAGQVALRLNFGSAHVILDVVGWYGQPLEATGLRFTALASPNRILDTRTSATPLVAGTPRVQQVAGQGGVPTGAKAAVMNFTVTEPSVPSHLTVYPSDQPAPNASNLNFVGGQTIPNLVISSLSTDGKISARLNAGTTHLVIDVSGYFS